MSVLVWPGLAVIVTVAMMLFQRRGSSREEPVNPVHYGHSDVADHEYDNLPPASSDPLESDAPPTPEGGHGNSALSGGTAVTDLDVS